MVNAAFFMPRKPGPTRLPPTDMNAGRSMLATASASMLFRYDRTDPMCGASISGFGTRPVLIRKVPRLWSPSVVVSERMIDRFLNWAATFGRCSVIWTPDAAVSIGLCSPPLALPGFMSQRSMVVGPPPIHRMTRLLPFFLSSAAWERRPDRNDRPGTVTAAAPAAWDMKCRRLLIPNMLMSNLGKGRPTGIGRAGGSGTDDGKSGGGCSSTQVVGTIRPVHATFYLFGRYSRKRVPETV